MVNRDRQRGALIGLAVGDALGAPVEFQPPQSFMEVTDFGWGGPFGLEPGQWTDDTSMALALADSLAEAGWDLNDQARRYLAWYKHGKYSVTGHCFDIGFTTRRSLAQFESSGDARSSGDAAENASGNGSIMRLAPVPIRYADLFPDRIEELGRLAAESSLTTHASPQCLAASRYMALLLAGLIHGVPRDDLLDPDWPPLDKLREAEPLHREVEDIIAGSFREKEPPVIQGSGYVIQCLEAALWAFHDAADFRQAVLRAVNLGDDADTTGAVCGQLAGACWGESGIPEEWREHLAGRELIEAALDGLGLGRG
ncbi:MAG: ADP-ribosylglycohydrolase family protein [Planctomycetes bacterium]|nr:ADP-ribosylglycohydrolase family protein [Planctomycetota bacterium]